MNSTQSTTDRRRFSRARQARDARFDGLFYVAVKTTGIYCRPICPATPPLEKNVNYYSSAIAAAQAGFRPCLRCHPDSAPRSNAWIGSKTSFHRAVQLIEQGALQTSSVPELASRLGISERYLRKLFAENLGVSVKQYAIYQQCLFAKQLLHESALSITDIAFASGFNSVRRFNEAMLQHIGLSPRKIRQQRVQQSARIQLRLSYRPPYAWSHIHAFLQRRVVENLEWASEKSYGRTIRYGDTLGFFELEHQPERNALLLSLELNRYEDLHAITQHIRFLFDIDAPIATIDTHLQPQLAPHLKYLDGMRIPGTWDAFEAGARAILGQQVSVQQARKLLLTLVQELGESIEFAGVGRRTMFPTANAVAESSLDFFRMPQARKDTLRRLAQHVTQQTHLDQVDDWIELKGIGPWTMNYVKMRALKDPDIWLEGDAGLRNAMKQMPESLDTELCRPWRSYLTYQLWNQIT